jgi:RNA polymerase sigma factor (TIGR02999 family)
MSEVTGLLQAWSLGDRQAFDELMPLVYEDLRRRARAYLRRERSADTLQTTSLVHEAYLKLVDQDQASWRTHGQFLAVAAQVMRRILVDHARSRQASKRGDGVRAITLKDSVARSAPASLDILALNQALERLAALDARQARIVELRYFAGLSLEDTAAAIELSLATVKREWTSARAWLFTQLNDHSSS